MNRLLLRQYALRVAIALAVSGCGKGDSGSLPAGPLLFRDATEEVGLSFVHDAGPVGAHPLPQIIGSGAALFDYDNDGRLDIYLIHNAGPASKSTNRLFHQEKDGRFRDVSAGSGLDIAGYGMGVAVGDINNDGWPDLLVTQYGGSRLFLNNGDGTFTEVTHEAGLDLVLWGASACGLAASHWRCTGFGTVMADFNQDGAPDLAVVNGRIQHSPPSPTTAAEDRARLGPFWIEYAERNQLFLNDGRGGFEDVSPANAPFSGVLGVFRGLAYGDIDGDGAVDLLVTSIAGAARLFHNVAPSRGHWLLVRVFDPALRRDAYGAEVTAIAGKQRWKCWANPAFSYLCSNEPRLHFGLGQTAHVDAFEVLWPDGTLERFDGCTADQAVELRKGTRQPVPGKRRMP